MSEARREARPEETVAQEKVAMVRMKDALRHLPEGQTFKTVARLAVLAGISTEDAMALLRADPEIVFSKRTGTETFLARLKDEHDA